MTAVSALDRVGSRDPSFNTDFEARLRALRLNVGAQRVVRSRFGLGEDAEGMARLARFFRTPAWATGTVGMVDALFLYEMIRCVRPERVLEIGVGSGVSTAVALFAMAEIGAPPMHADGLETVQAFDILPHFYLDATKPIGAAAVEIAGGLARGMRVHTGKGAAEAGAMFAGAPVSFAFIDADHKHPSPTADVLALAPALKPGAWVALHDIALAEVARVYAERTGKPVKWAHHGAQWLFERWPYEKIAGVGGARNIGAIRMPETGSVGVEELRELIDLPWEAEVPPEVRRTLGRP